MTPEFDPAAPASVADAGMKEAMLSVTGAWPPALSATLCLPGKPFGIVGLFLSHNNIDLHV
jgi:hypothetical protein